MLESVAWFYRTPELRFAFLAVLVIGLVAARPLSTLLRWDLWGTAVTLWGLGGALIPTFVSRLGYYDLRLDLSSGCTAGTDLWISEDSLLNLLLLAPFGVGVVWASRSALVGVVAVVTLGVGIEVGQAVSGLGACERGDLVRNVLGGLAAVGVGWGWQRLRGTAVSRPELARPRS